MAEGKTLMAVQVALMVEVDDGNSGEVFGAALAAAHVAADAVRTDASVADVRLVSIMPATPRQVADGRFDGTTGFPLRRA